VPYLSLGVITTRRYTNPRLPLPLPLLYLTYTLVTKGMEMLTCHVQHFKTMEQLEQLTGVDAILYIN